MDAAWKKGAYPGKRVHTLHGLQKKAVRYTQGFRPKSEFEQISRSELMNTVTLNNIFYISKQPFSPYRDK